MSYVLTACDFYTCSDRKFADSLNGCKTYVCESPLVGPTLSVEKMENASCKVSVGIKHYDESMQCISDVKDYLSAHEIYSKWVNSNKTEKEVTYSFSQLEIELFLDNSSAGKPFEYLANNGKCKYIKKP